MKLRDYTTNVVQTKSIFMTPDDEVEAFMEDRVDLLVGSRVNATTLYRAYADWAGVTAMTQTMFGRTLAAANILKRRTQTGHDYLHIALKPDAATA